jgi:DNA-directed RNA polymerase specialized sigma24 family protein
MKHPPSETHSLTDVDLNAKNDRPGSRQRSVEEQIARKQMNECIQANIAALPEGYRLILTLKELEGFKNSEIAAILMIPTKEGPHFLVRPLNCAYY